ncbi:hypothetical protein [Nocardia sp. alder85J]|uniref:hypothetical protein n=1 Tax=Nocardia sp. alder85J TaxID=2862949 RepID=UPI001CD3D0D1|nr:hypothetical protein [Nocardia sp. alder85J]MCX4096825.1 hypothetical protein [Nocardia sp. alder85J]
MAAPIALDEYPIHQTPLSLGRVGSSDRNFYDRCYFNAHDRAGGTLLITGLGVYPNLGVVDAYAALRRGDDQRVVRFSDALTERSLEQRVGGYHIEVLEPLRRLRIVCEHEDLGFDLTWTGAFPAVQEEPHLLLSGNRVVIDSSRFVQVGTWSGTIRADGIESAVDPVGWTGNRDRSWGIRGVGEPEPPGRNASEPPGGLWWLYVPLRFDDFSIVVIVQEGPDGHRTLNNAVRVWPDGRVEQLGWPRVRIEYRSGTRVPVAARMEMTDAGGEPLTVDIRVHTGIGLHMGCGYGRDPEWVHGQWRGRDWSLSSRFDLADPAVAARFGDGAVDHVGQARCGDAEGWGLFEHALLGRHAPTGFTEWNTVAP